MRMRKITATILSLLGAALLCAPIAPSTDSKTEPLTARASTSTELAFTSPTDVATTGAYTAVADGNTLYLFDRERGGFWQEYAHERAISQIAFNDDGELYFRDEYRNLYRLAVNGFTEETDATDTEIDCGAFFLHEAALYYANAADRNTLLYAREEGTTTPVLFNGSYKEFFLAEGSLYALGDDGLYTLNVSTAQATVIKRFSTPRAHLAVSGNKIFTTGENGLYCYDLEGGAESLLGEGAYAALCPKADGVYALKGREVYAYSTANNALQKAADEFTQPHVRNIPTGSLLDLPQGSGSFTLVETKPQALLVEVDVAEATDTLPLIKTTRGGTITALKIGETESYALFTYRTDATKPYQSFLVSKNGYEELPTPPDYDTPKVGYITSSLSSYELPHLGFPTLAELPRGAEVTLLGEVNGLDLEYYKVGYGETVGYLPKSYVVSFDGSKSSVTETTVGDGVASKEGIWRMAYILLGGTAIGVLVDFLILRKKNDD